MIDAATIGIDWGSTHVRAFRFGADGSVIETRRSDRGAAGLAADAYENIAREFLTSWLTGTADKIVVCGMAGSREGWIEARYLACPCTLSTLSHALVQAPGAMQALIAPGLYSQDARGIHDVLRGEETQILGAQDGEDAWFITPGTHSKWVEFRDGAITKFHTYMTGEFFGLLASHSVLSRTLDPNGVFDPDAFENGVTRGLAGGALSKIAFAVRAEALFNVLAPPAAASYLSGVLIGAEIADGLSLSNGNRLVLIGAKKIADLYLMALGLAGVSDVVVVDGEAASARGLWSIAKEVSP